MEKIHCNHCVYLYKYKDGRCKCAAELIETPLGYEFSDPYIKNKNFNCKDYKTESRQKEENQCLTFRKLVEIVSCLLK